MCINCNELVSVQITDTIERDWSAADEGSKAWFTRAIILDSSEMEEIDSFYGPVEEDWLPHSWDAALLGAGYERVGDWDDFDLRCTARRL